MNAEQFICLADSLRDRALSAGADLNASNFLVHATLMRALRERSFHELEHEALAHAVEIAKAKVS